MDKVLLTLIAILLVTASAVAFASIQLHNGNQDSQTSGNGIVQSQTNQTNSGSSSGVSISVYENSFPINETSPITQVKTIVTGNATQRSYLVESTGILYPPGTNECLDTKLLEDKDNATIIETINWGDVQALPLHGGAQLTSNTRTLTIINDGKDAATISIPTVNANFADYKVRISNYSLVIDTSCILQPGQKAVIAIFLHVSTLYNANLDPLPFNLNIEIIAAKISN